MALNEYEYIGAETTKDARMWAMLCHIAAFSAYIGIIPFGHLLGPLVIWLMKRDQYPFVDAHGKESLNFQLSMTIYGAAFTLIALILFITIVGIPLLILAIPLILIIALAQIILTVIAGIRANDGGFYEYPFTIRFLT